MTIDADLEVMGLRDAIVDMENEDLMSLFKNLQRQVLGEVKRGGKRRTSSSSEGHTVTYDFDGIRPKVAVRIVRNELVSRGCLPRVKPVRAYYDFNPQPACPTEETES